MARPTRIGGILGFAHEWADTQKTFKSYELWARYVAPHFQGQLGKIEANRAWFEGSFAQVWGKHGEASEQAYRDAGKELPPDIAEQIRERAARRGAEP